MSAKLIPDNVIISDATVLINFLNSGYFDLLIKIFENRLHITDIVRGEITQNNFELESAIKDGLIEEHKIPVEKINHLVKSFSNFDVGEASCFLLAKENNWKIATDDYAAKEFIKRELNPFYILTTFDILIEGINLRLIKKSDAVTIIKKMEDTAHFKFIDDEFKEFQKRLKNL